MDNFEVINSTFEVALFITSILLVLSVVASRLSGWLGFPVLLMFLGIGMIAGSDGIGGINFSNYSLTFAIGSLTLAFILFDGGLQTSWNNIQPILLSGIALSSVGVVITATSTAIFSHYFLNLSWSEGFLLGAIVSPTDAAAVFGVLRSQKVRLKAEVQRLLEFEAGCNDPAAILLTIATLRFATHPEGQIDQFIMMFLRQAGGGIILGFIGGHLACWTIKHLRLDFEGLYDVLMMGFVLLIFSGTSLLHSSGFIAVYTAGIVIGNSKIHCRKTLLQFFDGIGWISQISLFLVLGLLVFPTHLPALWRDGLILSLFLLLVARPLSVVVATPTRKLNVNDRLFISWVGLRGGAAIVLATLPWGAHFAKAEYFFNLVFFVVCLSVLIQGSTINWIARKLHITLRP